MPDTNNPDEQMARLIINFYSGDHPKTPRNTGNPAKEAMVSAGILAHDIMQKVLKEPGVNLSDEEEREIYANLMTDIIDDYPSFVEGGKQQTKS